MTRIDIWRNYQLVALRLQFYIKRSRGQLLFNQPCFPRQSAPQSTRARAEGHKSLPKPWSLPWKPPFSVRKSENNCFWIYLFSHPTLPAADSHEWLTHALLQPERFIFSQTTHCPFQPLSSSILSDPFSSTQGKVGGANFFLPPVHIGLVVRVVLLDMRKITLG